MDVHRSKVAADFTALYGAGSEAAEQLDRLFVEIGKAAAARPERLQELDLDREAAPGWLFDQVQLGYCCYVDRFGGTLNGIRERIPYLREMGVTYLHLLPFWRKRAGESDGGFAISDHETVDPALGTNDDLVVLAQELLDAGITLCSDLVLNHTADDHRWAVAARAGDEAYRAFYRIFPSRDLPDRFEATVAEIFPETAPGNFTWIPELEGWAWTTFYPFQWDLNWENPQVLVEMVRVILRLANLGVGAFRLDSAPFLWKQLGTDCQNRPETHTILKLIRSVIAIAAPGVVLKAEAVVSTQELPAYFGLPDAPGTECQLAYQTSVMAASWAAMAHQNTAMLRAVFAELPALGQAGTWLTYVRCHDDIGWRVLGPQCRTLGDPGERLIVEATEFYTRREPGTYARGIAFQSNGLMATNGTTASLTGIEAGLEIGDDAWVSDGIDRAILHYGLAMSMGGLPVIYMGDELGQLNATTAARETDGRWLHRPFFDTAAAANRHDPATLPGRIFARLSRLAGVRRQIPALRADQPLHVIDGGSDAILSFARSSRFLAAFNFSGRPVSLAPAFASFRGSFRVEAPRFRDLVNASVLSVDAILGPWRFVWLVPED